MELKVDGRRVYAATGGRPFDPGMPAVLFVHGAGMDHTVWQLQARWFAWHGHAVLAVDLPGHGRSEGPALGSVPQLAHWLGRVMDAAGARRAAIVGHSMGGAVAGGAAGRGDRSGLARGRARARAVAHWVGGRRRGGWRGGGASRRAPGGEDAARDPGGATRAVPARRARCRARTGARRRGRRR